MTSASPSDQSADASSAAHRLHNRVTPTHYELHLTPNLTHAPYHFSATVRIHLRVTKPTKVITLNAVELDLHSVSVQQNDHQQQATVKLDEDEETARLTFPTQLSEGDAVLSIEYSGLHNDEMRGCYRSKYTTPTGQQRFMCVTQFESVDARRALPCFDEPAIKAAFTVSLTVDADLVAVSNMPIEETSEEKAQGDGGKPRVTHRFHTTPVMSTYLLGQPYPALSLCQHSPAAHSA